MEGMGEEKLHFLFLNLVKCKKAQFWAKCLNSFRRRLKFKKIVERNRPDFYEKERGREIFCFVFFFFFFFFC